MSIKPILNGQIQLLTRQQLEQFIQGKKIDLNNVEIQFASQKNSTNQYNILSQEPQITQQQQHQQQDQTLPQLSQQKLIQAQILPIINQDQEVLNQKSQVQQIQQQKIQQYQIQQENQEISQNQNLQNDINNQQIPKLQTVPQTKFHFLPNSQTQQQSPANFQGFIQNTNIVQAPQPPGSVLHSAQQNQNQNFQNPRFQSQNFLNQNEQVQSQKNSTNVDEQLKISYMQNIYILFVIYEILILTCLILQFVYGELLQAASLWISVQVFVIVSFILLYVIWLTEILSHRLIAFGFRVFFFFLSEILEFAAFSLAVMYQRFSSVNIAFTMQFCFTIYFYYFYTKKDYETFQSFRKQLKQKEDNQLQQSQMVNQSQEQFISHYHN